MLFPSEDFYLKEQQIRLYCKSVHLAFKPFLKSLTQIFCFQPKPKEPSGLGSCKETLRYCWKTQTENQETPYFTGRYCSQVIHHSVFILALLTSKPKPCGKENLSSHCTQQSCTADTEETWTRSGSSCQGTQQGSAGHLSSGLRVFQGKRGTAKTQKTQ